MLKNFSKKFQKSLVVSKICLTFATAFASKRPEAIAKMVLEKNEKFFLEKFGGFKKMLYLCNRFPLQMRAANFENVL